MAINARVVVVDDQAFVLACLCNLLQQIPGVTIVGQACSAEAVLPLVALELPDLLLMDMRMPGMGGVEGIARALALSPKTRVLAITASIDAALLARALEYGAVAFLSKDSSLALMQEALTRVCEGQRYISPLIVQTLAGESVPATEIGAFQHLSARELQIVLLLVSGLTADEVARKMGVHSRTIKSYRVRCFEKLDIKNDVELTLLAARYGLLYQPQPLN